MGAVQPSAPAGDGPGAAGAAPGASEPAWHSALPRRSSRRCQGVLLGPARCCAAQGCPLRSPVPPLLLAL